MRPKAHFSRDFALIRCKTAKSRPKTTAATSFGPRGSFCPPGGHFGPPDPAKHEKKTENLRLELRLFTVSRGGAHLLVHFGGGFWSKTRVFDVFWSTFWSRFILGLSQKEALYRGLFWAPIAGWGWGGRFKAGVGWKSSLFWWFFMKIMGIHDFWPARPLLMAPGLLLSPGTIKTASAGALYRPRGLCRKKWSVFHVFGHFLRSLAGRMSPVYRPQISSH